MVYVNPTSDQGRGGSHVYDMALGYPTGIPMPEDCPDVPVRNHCHSLFNFRYMDSAVLEKKKTQRHSGRNCLPVSCGLKE